MYDAYKDNFVWQTVCSGLCMNIVTKQFMIMYIPDCYLSSIFR
jgi:hypothetical protein